MSKAEANDPALNILIIDDEPVVLESLEKFLKSRGHEIFTASRGQEGIALLLRERIDVVITDICMPAMDGFEVLEQVKQLAPEAEVIVITGHGDIDAAVRALREGAFDFFSKPLKLRELTASLQRTIRFHTLRQEKNHYQERLSHLAMEGSKNYGLDAIIGESPPIQRVKNLIQLVCNTEATTVLICGETGTGKELVARAIHYGSKRATGPFVPVDCTAIPETLIESDLYGHMKGAFTDAKEARRGCFELADGGTLFLDEIGDMAPLMQAKLLRTLEQRCIRRVGGGHEIPVDVRVVSATNRDLSQAARRNQFREDLYYRLNTITIHIPPLRERREDIPVLARYFLRRYIRELRKPIEGFAPEAEDLLPSYSFPGNIRELRNTIERAAILCTGTHISPQDLCLDHSAKATDQAADTLNSSSQSPSSILPPPPFATLDLATLEKQAVQEALRRTNNNQVQAATLLGVSRTALRRRLQRCGGKQ